MTQHLVAGALLLLSLTSAFAADYVGRDKCQSCHVHEYKLWQNSHHDLAMDHANSKTVLGDFSNTTFKYAGISSKFYKQKNKFMVQTDGQDGKLHDYEIKYTFGVTPLQQYLIELDNGKLQALSIAWDTRAKTDGGQRWFHLYPDEEITFDDELHWTRPSFNWNGMCAECHSTNLKKNYDTKTDSFKTSWSEIDVSCEACHGPASDHLIWVQEKKQSTIANKGFDLLFDERKDIHWNINKDTGSALRDQPRTSRKEIEVCAQCHSRRSAISDDYSPGKSFMNHYILRLLDEGMYYADGQIQDEVYVYGSFLQSKMYHKGVTCGDCHEPHSLELRREGNGVCLQCHAAEKFDNKKHHFHNAGGKGGECAECHMPPRDYMVIDARHDHSIRIPHPDLSVALGTPNACNQCHEGKHASWAATAVKNWYGKSDKGYQQYAFALDASRKGNVNAGEILTKLIRDSVTPDIARASALSEFTSYLDQSNIDVLQEGLKDEDATVRLASVSALEGLPQAMLAQLAFPLLDDSVRSVRIEAARVLAPVPVGQLQGELINTYNRAAKEYIYSQQVNAERPEAQFNLGNYYAAKGEYDKAIAAYKKSIHLEDVFVPAYINLTDLYRLQGDDDAAEMLLLRAIEIAPKNADIHYALGLLKIRQKKNAEAVKLLQRAVEFDTSNAHYVYVYAIALNSTGQKDVAIEVLQRANDSFPKDTNILEALIVFYREDGNEFAAQTLMK
ncbi:MAG: tetratricopeptide repeat protein, partial [Gammaproteobacteria bacterium]|nr:tetratricopeptide repeat protein [Gammaproteobacteria bacterium]